MAAAAATACRYVSKRWSNWLNRVLVLVIHSTGTSPGSPLSPFGPCGPGGPCSPCGPAGPGGPCSPCGPGGPWGPGGPCSPGGAGSTHPFSTKRGWAQSLFVAYVEFEISNSKVATPRRDTNGKRRDFVIGVKLIKINFL